MEISGAEYIVKKNLICCLVGTSVINSNHLLCSSSVSAPWLKVNGWMLSPVAHLTTNLFIIIYNIISAFYVRGHLLISLCRTVFFLLSCMACILQCKYMCAAFIEFPITSCSAAYYFHKIECILRKDML